MRMVPRARYIIDSLRERIGLLTEGLAATKE